MIRILCYLSVLGFVSAISLEAQEKPIYPKTYVFIDPDETDDDFAYQGEYAGQVEGESTGLQVIARGGGAFEARLLTGGLPGEGWDGSQQWRMNGKRKGDTLKFTREAYLDRGDTKEKTTLTYVVDGETAKVLSKEGKTLGTLKKVIRKSPTLGYPAPWGAVTLFDGDDLYQFKDGRISPEGLLEEGSKMRDVFLKDYYQDFILHLEFRLPYKPYATGQDRGNSGCYLQQRYEVQILDSFGLDPEFNYCGALYRYKAPDVNMCLPPLQWQTYEIEFKAARFDKAGKKTKNAVITVWHNGVKIHDHFELERKTGAGKQESPEHYVTKFQDHGNPVRFRNMWIIDLNRPIPAPAAHPGFEPWSPEQVVSQN
ncbi:MAG: DUF1080 domain-containing protein [Planctomycetaceae bacterium]|nr:DUF1080 domain-containing protein [Planctomycetaceae bacterium]